MFRCKWFNLEGGVNVDLKYGMTTVHVKNLGYDTEPFVLANDVARVFYVKYMSSRSKKRKDKQSKKRKDKQANTSYDEPKHHIVFQGKETSWEWRTRQTHQKITIIFIKFRPSQGKLTQTLC